jgi:hypothetical protein
MRRRKSQFKVKPRNAKVKTAACRPNKTSKPHSMLLLVLVLVLILENRQKTEDEIATAPSF